MAEFEKFHYKNIDELRDAIGKFGVDIQLSDDLGVLKRPVKIGKHTAPNSMAILPMEGCDCDAKGAPAELTRRRYLRFAQGGAGLIWFEACAVDPSGRANPRQMSINDDTVDSLKSLVEDMLEKSEASMGHRPLNILQLTHSGRWSRPVDKPAPVIAQHDPLLDPVVNIGNDYPVITDDELDRLQDRYVYGARLAKVAGFDGVDFKIAHRYLISELLAAHVRGGKYGGSFENRTGYVLETFRRIRDEVGPDFIVGCRMSVYDAHPYPYGWGVDKEDMWKVDYTEPMRLAGLLKEQGIDMVNASLGNTYYRYPYVTRPYDKPTFGSPLPGEHPLESINRIYDITRTARKNLSGVPLIGSGYSWFRQYMFQAGAANIKNGAMDMLGLGRMALAYPDAPRDLLQNGGMDPNKVCITCSGCTQLMRDHGQAGCILRDAEIYGKLYKQYRGEALARLNAQAKKE